jgi:hypothetical protein
VTARRAKRENGGMGEDRRGSTMTYLQVTHLSRPKAKKVSSEATPAERRFKRRTKSPHTALVSLNVLTNLSP